MDPTCFEDYGFSLIEKFVGDLAEPIWVKVSGGDAGTEFLLDINSPVLVSGIRGLAGVVGNLHPDMFCPEMTKYRDDENCIRYQVDGEYCEGNDIPTFYMAYSDIQEAYLNRLSELNLPIPVEPINHKFETAE